MRTQKIWLSVLLLGIGVLFICIGVLREEHLTVLRKAVRICFECIGIG
ncbi:MAG: CD1871A family CXXC motif-containing protein [Christensenellales bacterium]